MSLLIGSKKVIGCYLGTTVINSVILNGVDILNLTVDEFTSLINYDWSTTTASGLRYLRDVGSTPTYNASMYFGRGAYLNGVDQSITVPINTTIQTALKRVNGVVTINEASQTLTNYVISGLGVHKDYYLFTRLLTTAEKDSYTNTPELFYAMAQADSTCVLNMPMCETDKYARNMKSYTVGSTNLFTSGISVATKPTITNIANGYSVVKTSSDAVPWLAFNSTAPATDAIVKLCFNFTLVAGSVYPTITGTYTSEGSKNLSTPYQIKEGYNELVVQSWASTRLVYLLINQLTEAFTWNITNIIVNALTGIYSIANYTSSVRDNAKNLQYGLQTCKFVRDSLGVIQSASDYLECDGVGYAVIPSHTDTVNIKMTVNPTSLSGNLLSGGATKTLTGLTLNIDNDVVISNVTPTGAITLASGFSGTIKTYTEELV